MELVKLGRSSKTDLSHQEDSDGGAGPAKTFRFGNGAIALLLAIFTATVLTATAPNIGLTWDEPVYIEASESYTTWMGELIAYPEYALSDQVIKEYWDLNHEHPPLDKAWSGLIWAGARYVFDDLTAHRLGNILLVGLLIALVYLMVAPDYGRAAGLAAVGALLTMPRFFFHAHLAALDVPTTITMFLVCFVFWRTIDRPELKWSLVLGIVFGLALATKINALFELPFLLFLWAFIFRRRLHIFARLLIMVLIGILVWVMLWPWLYHDMLNRLTDYVSFLTVNHYKIEQWYRWHLYSPPPWHFPFVMTVAVVPLMLMIFSALGTFYVIRGRGTDSLGWLFVLGTLIPMIVLASGKAQVFDDDRLLMPSFPFLAALAGIGFAVTIQSIHHITLGMGHRSWAMPLILLLVAVTFLPQVAFAYTLYPHLLSYYSESIGGLSGAARLGLENTYWSETYFDALSFLNAHAPTGALVWVEAHDVMLYYQLHGSLRSDLRIGSQFGNEAIVKGMRGYKASIGDADYAVIQYRQSGFSGEIVRWMSSRKPVYQLTHNQIPLLEIYER